MRENKVVYGLIGYGGMGRWHTEILSNVPDAVIGGIYDIKKEKREEAKEKGFFVYETEEAMLADPDIDVVLIATPNDCHKPIAIRAMHAGKNVISEKPVTLSSADLLEMENAAKETGKLLTVHQNRRWDGGLVSRRGMEKYKRYSSTSCAARLVKPSRATRSCMRARCSSWIDRKSVV